MNRPAGKAKTRKGKGPPTKPYIERDDGQNWRRFDFLNRTVLGLSSEEAELVRQKSSGGKRSMPGRVRKKSNGS